MASVLQLQAAKDYLNLGSSTTNDAEVQAFIDSAEATIAQRVGPLQPTSVSERLRPTGRSNLVLNVLPVIGLVSVTPVGGTALTVTDLYVGPDSGVVELVNGGAFTAAAYDVAYSAGRPTCPPDLLLGVKELVRHLWATQRGAGNTAGSPFSDQTGNTVPGAAFILPFRVTELIGPHMAAPGFA